MARKSSSTQTVVEPPVEETEAPAAKASPEQDGPPQGIVIRHLRTGNPTKDFHPKHRNRPMIDPASLVVDGKDPILMVARDGIAQQVAKRVGATHAALLLTCDFVTGSTPLERLATDEEAAKYEADQADRVARAGKRK